MNKQEIISKVYEFFSRPGAVLSKNERDPDEGGLSACYYRHPENSAVRCAIGCIMPDELYNPSMESVSVAQLLKSYPEVARYFDCFKPEDVRWFAELQYRHDSARDVDELLSRLRRFAIETGLEPPTS